MCSHYGGSSYNSYPRCFTQSQSKRVILARMTIFSRRKPPFYDGHSSLYPTVRRRQFIADVRPRFMTPPFPTSVLSLSFQIYLPVYGIDYASSSLSDVLVSIGDIGVGGTRTFHFSRPELLDFFNVYLNVTSNFCKSDRCRDCDRQPKRSRIRQDLIRNI